ncbi:MAG: porin [Burkholderiaceae bacterium]
MNVKIRPCIAIVGGVLCAAANAQNSGLTQVAPADNSALTAKVGKSSVTLYGLIEPTISDIDHSTAANGKQLSYQDSWFSASRLGFLGTHPLGQGDLDAIFKLEAEYLPRNGNMGTANVLFNRDAWAGLSSATFGKLTFGRQNTVARDFSAIYGDPYGSAVVSTEEGGYTNQNNFKILVNYAGSATGSRMDNGVVWKKVWDNGLAAGLGFQFGGVAGNLQRGQTKAGALGYNGGPFHVAGYYTEANVTGHTDRSYSVGANYDMGLFRLGGGYYHYTGTQSPKFVTSRSDKAYTAHIKFSPAGKIDYTLGYLTIRAKNAGSDAAGNVINVFADPAAATVTKLVSGDRDTIYGAVVYHFDKTSDIYVAADHLRLTDGYRVSTAPNSTTQNEYAIGLRYKF